MALLAVALIASAFVAIVEFVGGGNRALSAHVLVADTQVSEATAILKTIDRELRSRYAITHVTVQFECESCDPDGRVVCPQRGERMHAQGGR